MNNYFALTKILIKNGSPLGEKNRKKKLKTILFALLLAIAFLPMATSFGTLISGLYNIFAKIHQEGAIVGIILSIVSAVIFFFGLFYVISVFYFSKDIESLLPLPLKSSQILGAKFTVTIIYEYLTEVIFLLPVLITFGIKSGGGIFYYMYSAVIFLTLPIIPITLASIITMIIMRFTNIAKNKDRFSTWGGVAAISLGLGINMYMQSFSKLSSNENQLREMIMQGNNSLINLISTLFPSAKLAAAALINSSNLSGATSIFFYLAVNTGFIAFFILMGEALYFKGVIGISQTSSKRKRLSKKYLEKSTMQSSLLKSYLLKELRILFRTPVYFMNCILMNFLWPIFLLMPILFQSGGSKNLISLTAILQNGSVTGIILAGGFALSLFVTSTNSITPTSISREGQNIFVSKYLPVSFKVQIMAKVLSGVVMGIIGTTTMFLTAIFIAKVPAYLLLLSAITACLGIFFSAFTGMIIDLNFPKLVWDNEQKAVKQNMNVLFNMLISVTFAGLVIYAAMKLSLSLWTVFGSIIVLFGILDVVLYKILMTKGVKLFERIEI